VSSPADRPPLEDVLNAFAVEAKADRESLERYLRAYPDYAGDLIDLSRALSRAAIEDDAPLSSADQALIDSAWRRHAAATGPASDPFEALSTADLREVASRLGVPRQVISAFRERRVVLSTVPRRFMGRLAEVVNTSQELLESLWATPAPALARSYKADRKPDEGRAVTFERLLIDAGVPQDKRAQLMLDAD
jgi:hypothetical protein